MSYEYDAMDVNRDTTTLVEPTLVAPLDHRPWLNLAQTISEKSPDPSTQVGCVLVARDDVQPILVGWGCNTFPDDVEQTPDRLNNRADKYMWMVHAETRAVHNWLRNLLAGAPLIAPAHVCAYVWGLAPCLACLKDLHGVGIRTVYYHNATTAASNNARWTASDDHTLAFIAETGLRLVCLNHVVIENVVAPSDSSTLSENKPLSPSL